MMIKLVSSSCLVLLAQIEIPSQLSSGSIKDLTVSGLLICAVVFLYRELGRERKKSEEVAGSTRAFIQEQTLLMQGRSERTVAALDGVTQSLTALQASTAEQIDLHRTHIQTILDRALKDGPTPRP